MARAEHAVPPAAAGPRHPAVRALPPRAAHLLREDHRHHAHGEAPLRHVQELVLLLGLFQRAFGNVLFAKVWWFM